MFGLFKKTNTTAQEEPKGSFFKGEHYIGGQCDVALADRVNFVISQNNRLIASVGDNGMDEDSADNFKLMANQPQGISKEVAKWYASHSFIGHQLAALFAQNWLINKACAVPARDATRNGYDIVSTDGTDIPLETIKILQKYDKKYRIKKNCEQFVHQGRIFGIRIALFDIDSDDPEFYEKPFNIDGVTEGSYKGIIQVDPYWCTPLIVGEELRNSASQHFYEPTYWQINGKKYHRSHLVIFKQCEVPDILKPMYLYGGIPIPQLIMERVYGSERTASEALNLVMSKRTSVWLTNTEMFFSNLEQNMEKMQTWIEFRDNNGIKIGDSDSDQFQQFDTALGDVDSVIMTQYQLVAAAANVPATKLLGTSPKGFNSTGEAEAKNYAQELESIQEHDLTELVERHHQLVMKSCGLPLIDTSINWRPIDSPTAKELAELNKLKADTYSELVMSGAIDGEDVRFRIASDPESGFHDLGDDSSNEILKDLGLSEEQIQSMNDLGVSLNA